MPQHTMDTYLGEIILLCYREVHEISYVVLSSFRAIVYNFRKTLQRTLRSSDNQSTNLNASSDFGLIMPKY